MRPFLILLILLTLLAMPVRSQKFEWMAGTDGFLDNREYFSIDDPQTIFGSRVKGELGASLAGTHRFRIGMNYLYEFGSHPGTHLPDVIMYYQYDNDRIDFRIGAFPRANILDSQRSNLLDYPLSLLSDTLLYYRPNLEGAYLGFRGAWGYQQAFIDWTSRQTDETYERFIFGFSGLYTRNLLFINHHVMMGHFAAKGIPEPGFHLRDNGGFDVNLGLNLSESALLDSLSVSIGGLVSLDRTRGVDEGWQTPAGFTAQLHAFYKWFGVQGFYYTGEGHTFLYGDPFYRLKQYGRVDIFYMPFHNRNVSLKINFILHFAHGQLDYSQQILLSMALNGK